MLSKFANVVIILAIIFVIFFGFSVTVTSYDELNAQDSFENKFNTVYESFTDTESVGNQFVDTFKNMANGGLVSFVVNAAATTTANLLDSIDLFGNNEAGDLMSVTLEYVEDVQNGGLTADSYFFWFRRVQTKWSRFNGFKYFGESFKKDRTIHNNQTCSGCGDEPNIYNCYQCWLSLVDELLSSST